MIAEYTVIIRRTIGDEDGQNYLGVKTDADAIEQLRKELQHNFDDGTAGRFEIVKRELKEE